MNACRRAYTCRGASVLPLLYTSCRNTRSPDSGLFVLPILTGKLGENSDANAGSRALCPNFRPKKVWLKVRTNFHVFGCFIIIYHFMVYKMCYRFPSVVSKLPLQKGDEPSGSSFVRALNPKSDHWNGFVRTFTQFTNKSYR